MAGEMNVLAHRLNLFSERNRHYRDFTLNILVHAIREIIACFPVYRTYVTAGAEAVSPRDAWYIDRAVDEAKRRNPATAAQVFDFVRDVLLKRADYIPERERDEYLRFVTRFQQTTSPVTAKGIEDTAFYVYNRLVSLNEVGGEPAHFGVSPAICTAGSQSDSRRWPSALSTTSTHDTKRSEDVRARISVLSEIPGAWKAALARWSRFNKRHHTTVRGHAAPDRNEEYLLYQTLLGAWPLQRSEAIRARSSSRRICEYMIKALREAKRHSSWLNPNPAWEEAVGHFVRQLLHPVRGARFLEDFRPLAARVAQSGMWNSLSQTLIKVTAPGVPDFYQGTEVWNLSLVDPDNRRPVDFARLQSLLAQLPILDDGMRGMRLEADQASPVDDLLTARDGWTHQAVRQRHCAARPAADPDLYLHGDYLPLGVTGARAAHVFAFARATRAARPSSIVPRLTAMLVQDPGTPPRRPRGCGPTHAWCCQTASAGKPGGMRSPTTSFLTATISRSPKHSSDFQSRSWAWSDSLPYGQGSVDRPARSGTPAGHVRCLGGRTCCTSPSSAPCSSPGSSWSCCSRRHWITGYGCGAGQLAGFPAPARVHLPGRHARRQPRGGLHRRAAVLPGDDRGHPHGPAGP